MRFIGLSISFKIKIRSSGLRHIKIVFRGSKSSGISIGNLRNNFIFVLFVASVSLAYSLDNASISVKNGSSSSAAVAETDVLLVPDFLVLVMLFYSIYLTFRLFK